MQSNYLELLFFAPTLLFTFFLLGAIALCIVKWKRFPYQSQLVFFSLLLQLIAMLGTRILQTLLPRFLNVQEMGFYFGVIGFAATLISIVSWCLILAAVYTLRSETQNAVAVVPERFVPPIRSRVTKNPYDP